MRHVKIITFGIIFILLATVEFLMGFFVAICDHWSDATKTFQNLYNEAIRKAEPKINTDK